MPDRPSFPPFRENLALRAVRPLQHQELQVTALSAKIPNVCRAVAHGARWSRGHSARRRHAVVGQTADP